MSYAETVAALTGPGGPFELVTETVKGLEIPVFKNRMHSLRELLSRSLEFGDAEFVVWDHGIRWSFVDHERLVASVAAALREKHGVGPGSRVAILASNCPEWMLTAWATLSLGGVVVAMNGWWQGDEIRYGIELSEPELLVADRARQGRLADHTPGVPTIVIEDDFASYQDHDRNAALSDAPIAEDDLAAIMFTSGTTGRPKGAMISHRNFLAFIQMNFCNGAIAFMTHPPEPEAPPSVSIVSSPLFHVSGFQGAALMGLASGLKAVWTTGRFDPKKIMRLTLEEGVTRWGGITTQLWRLIEDPDFEPDDFRQIRSTGGGGSAFSPDLQRTLREKLPQASDSFNVGYGFTECAGLCSMATGDLLLENPDVVGRTLPGNDVAIFDDEGERLPDGVDGNICVRGANVMLGYWRNPEATAEAFFDDGWLRSGDIGQMRDGLLFLASRKRDMIIRGGENIYPREIEEVLFTHPAVGDVAIVGVPDAKWGERLVAFVRLAPDGFVEADELEAYVRDRLARHKVPREWQFLDELPMTASGKVQKFNLRENYVCQEEAERT